MRLPHAPTISLGIFLIVVCALGLYRTHQLPQEPHIELLQSGSGITLEGAVSDAPEIGDRSITYTLSNLSMSGAAIGGQILLRDFAMWPRYRYGETLRVTGDSAILSHDGYDAALRAQGFSAQMFAPRIASIGPAPWSFFGSMILVRESIELRLGQLLHEPRVSLMIGLLTGTRAAFPDSLTEDLRRSGLTHITAISGFNVTIVLVVLEGMFFFLPRRWRLLPLLAGLALFTLFTGASSSVVRAAIMGGLGIVALHAGRLQDRRKIILWAAGTMLLWNPHLLADDLGFQLSFLSVIGILELSPFLEPKLRLLPDTLGFRESILLTIASQVTAAPWLAYRLGTVSLISPFANVLAVPAIPWAMLLGTVALVTSLPWTALGLVPAFLANIVLSWIISVAHVTAALPFAALSDLTIHWSVIVLYYAALVWALWYTRKTRPTLGRAGDIAIDQTLRTMLSRDSRPAP